MRVRFTSPHPKDFSDDVLQVCAPLLCVYGWCWLCAGSDAQELDKLDDALPAMPVRRVVRRRSHP